MDGNMQILPWERVESSREFRAAAPEQQSMIRSGWFHNVAPAVYGPAMQDPRSRTELYNRIVKGTSIPLIPGEEDIVTPDTLTGLHAYESIIHENPAFASRSYDEQQALKAVWFNQLVAENPEVRQMDPRDLNEYFQKLMRTRPAFGTGLYQGNLYGGSVPMDGLLLPLKETEDPAELSGELPLIISNLMDGLLKGAGSMFIGPINALTGDDSAVTQGLRDWHKETGWIKHFYGSDRGGVENLFLQGVPSFLGYVGGVMKGPFGALDRLLGGQHRIVQLADGSGGLAGAIASKAGILQRAGSAVGLGKLPTLAYEVASGTLVGAAQGVGTAMMEERPWHENLRRDMTLGAGYALLSRYAYSQMRWQRAKKATYRTGQEPLRDVTPGGVGPERQLPAPGGPTPAAGAAQPSPPLRGVGGVPMEAKGTVHGPIPMGSPSQAAPALQRIFKDNPDLEGIYNDLEVFDQYGFSQEYLVKPEGIRFKVQDLLGLQLNEYPDKTEIAKPDGEVMATFEGPLDVMGVRIDEWLNAPQNEALWDMWSEVFEGKSISEAIMTAPGGVTLRMGTSVPEEARWVIWEELAKGGSNVPGELLGPVTRTHKFPTFVEQKYVGPQPSTSNADWWESFPPMKSLRLKQIDPGEYALKEPVTEAGFSLFKQDDSWYLYLDTDAAGHPQGGVSEAVDKFDTLKDARANLLYRVNEIREHFTTTPDVPYELLIHERKSIFLTGKGRGALAVNQSVQRGSPEWVVASEGLDHGLTGTSSEAIRQQLSAVDIPRKLKPEIKKTAVQPGSSPVRWKGGSPTQGNKLESLGSTPHADAQEIDGIYHVLRSTRLSMAKKAERLGSMGYVLNDEPSDNIAEWASVLKKVTARVPDHPVLYVNKRAGEILKPEDIPMRIVESPFVQEPYAAHGVMVGNGDQIRRVLMNTRQEEITSKVLKSKMAKRWGVDIFQADKTNAIEVEFNTPGGGTGTMWFPTFSAARSWAEQGMFSVPRGTAAGVKRVPVWLQNRDDAFQMMAARKGTKIPAGEETLHDPIYQSYQSWLKDHGKIQTGKSAVEWKPFAFTAHLADQQGYWLGRYAGKYVVAENIPGATPKTHSFTTLEDTINWLSENPRTEILPDFLDPVPYDALVEVLGPAGIEALAKAGRTIAGKMEPLPIKRTKKFTLMTKLRMDLQPVTHAVEMLEHQLSTQGIYNVLEMQGIKTNFTQMLNTLNNSGRLLNSFQNEQVKRVKQIFSGVKGKRQRQLMYELRESGKTLPTEEELGLSYAETKYANRRPYEMVYAQIQQEFGAESAKTLARKAGELDKWFRELFNTVGLDYDLFETRYLPHMVRDARAGNLNLSVNLSHTRFGTMPDADKAIFIELVRDGDIKQIVLEDDMEVLAQVYTNLAGRMLYERPTIKKIGDVFRALEKQMHAGSVSSKEFAIAANYFGNILRDLQGQHTDSEEIGRYAFSASVERISSKYQEVMKPPSEDRKHMKRSVDGINTAMSMMVAAHQAGRLWPIARNLTQPLVYAPWIGPRWVFAAVDEALHNPAWAQEAVELGLGMDPGKIPVGTGEIIPPGFVRVGMYGYSMSDLWNRYVTYKGLEMRGQHALKRHLAKKTDSKKFLREAGAHLFGASQYNEVIRMFNTKDPVSGARMAIDHIANMGVNHFQYIYKKHMAPQAFRHGVGRLFGTYTTWPLNFASMLHGTFTSDSLSTADKIKIGAGLLLTLAGISEVLYEAGLDARNFDPLRMGILGPGPYSQVLWDVTRGIGGDLNAWNAAGRTLSTVIPYIYAGESTWKAFVAFQEGELYEGLMHLMSAPLRYDLHPRRAVPRDTFLGWWDQIGRTYTQAQRGQQQRIEGRREVIRDIREILRP